MTTLLETLPYIEGNKFADLIPFKIQQSGEIRDRMHLVEEIVTGKTVLHIGCLDHLPLIEEKIKHNRWFHGRMTAVASRCLGVDFNKDGVKFVQETLGIDNVCHGNIDAPDTIPELTSGYWDYVVFGEILEHVDNPVDFLAKFLNNYRGNIGSVIITVPNAFRIGNFLAVLKGYELINSDHRYWFSPYTLWKVVHQAGFQAESIQMCKFTDDSGFKAVIKNAILKKYPLLAEDVVVICKAA
jgi:hypothetical protein